MNNFDVLREILAEQCHKQWTYWMRQIFKNSCALEDGDNISKNYIKYYKNKSDKKIKELKEIDHYQYFMYNEHSDIFITIIKTFTKINNININLRILNIKFIELLHNQWSGWIKHVLKHIILDKDEDFGGYLPKWGSEHWRRQMKTPYDKLSEKEKDADRNEADKFIAILKTFITEEKEPVMNIYLVERTDNVDYSEYVSFVIITESEEIAKNTNPKGKLYNTDTHNDEVYDYWGFFWCKNPNDVKVTLLGIADKNISPGIVHAIYHAG